MYTIVLILLGVIAVIIVILLLIIISMLRKTNNEEIEEEVEYRSDKAFTDIVSMPDIMGVSFPPSMEKLSKSEVLDITRKVYESYKIFDYKNMDIYELDKKEWHSWQVSFLFMMFKKDEEFFIPNQEQVFHDFLLSSNENDIKGLVRGLIKKYKSYVNINLRKDVLSKEYIWSNKDVSILFYFLANYKNYKK